MPACSSNVNVCGEYFVQALLPYLRVHERFRWGQLNQLARSMVYTPLYEEKAMVESLRLSLGHLDADPQNLMRTVPPECGTDDTSRLWWLGQKLTNWHMYGARFNHLAMKRAARARAFEVQRLKSLYNECKGSCASSAGTGSVRVAQQMKIGGGGGDSTLRQDVWNRMRERCDSCEDEEIGDPVLNDLAMRFTYYDTMKCRRKWDPEDRSLAPCTSSMDCDFNSLNNRILPLYDDHVCLNLTIIPVFRQQASVVPSPASQVDESPFPSKVVAHRAPAEHTSKPSKVEGPLGVRVDECGFRLQDRTGPSVRGNVRISSSPSPSTTIPSAVTAAAHSTNDAFTPEKNNEPSSNNNRHHHHRQPNHHHHYHYRPSACQVMPIDPASSRDAASPTIEEEVLSSSSVDLSHEGGRNGQRCSLNNDTFDQPYICCMVQPDDATSSTRLGHTFKQLGDYLNHKNFFHDDIFVPFIIKALLNNPYWAHELVHTGYPMEVLFWAWSICADATLFNGVTQLPAPVRYRFPDHPSSLLVSSSPRSWPAPASSRQYYQSLQRHKERYAVTNRDDKNHKSSLQRKRFEFHFQYRSSLGGFDPSQLVSMNRRKPWEFHPWNVASITNYINPEEENQLRLNRKLCVQAHSYLCCSLLFDIQSRIHKLYGGGGGGHIRHQINHPASIHGKGQGKMDLAISCFWDPAAHVRIKPCKS